MVQQSTVISDGVLSLSAFFLAYTAYRLPLQNLFFTGSILMAFAALVGVFRFRQAKHDEVNRLLILHGLLSAGASMVGIGYMALPFVYEQLSFISDSIITLATGWWVVCSIAYFRLPSSVTDLMSAPFICLVLYFESNLYIKGGFAVTAVAGLMYGRGMDLFGMLAVDVFHYMLVVANILFYVGITM